ncbi:MAG: hypothetical protein WC061_01305 [Melioribacteraceae bacterium]
MNKFEDMPLYQKLGIKEGFQIKLINEPDDLRESFNGSNNRIYFHKRLKEPVDLIHLFTRSKKELLVELPALKKYLKENGVLWVSWPERNSCYASDLNESVIREIGGNNGLTGMEICSIDENWSALKFIFNLPESS